MTEHRYPCPADPYPLIGSLDSLGHRHACIHDALHRPKHPVVEHACDCGMTWTEHVEMPKTSHEALMEYLSTPAPETWLQRQPVWRILAAVFGGCAVVFVATFALASAVGAL